MENAYYDLSYGQLGLAAILMLIAAVISLCLNLGLEKKLVLASVRAVVQLLLIGLVLQWVFAIQRW